QARDLGQRRALEAAGFARRQPVPHPPTTSPPYPPQALLFSRPSLLKTCLLTIPCPHPTTESISLRAASHPRPPRHPQELNLHPEFRRPDSQAAPARPS